MKRIYTLLILTFCITQFAFTQNKVYLSQTGLVDSIYSQVLGQSRKIYIQAPQHIKANQKYPVAYVLDGEILLPAVKTIHDYYSGGYMPEMFIIGISNDHDRLRDLTTSPVKTLYDMPAREANGEAENFVTFLNEELFPHIENNYPVTGYRTLIGHSYGGLFTMYALINHSDLFANYLAIDPSMDWDDQRLLKEAKEKLTSKQFAHQALFISLSGQLHMQNSSITIDNVMEDQSEFTLFARSNIETSEFIKSLDNNGLSYEWKFYPNDLHGTVQLPSIMDGLISIFSWYQMENTDKINNPQTTKEELLAIIDHRENKLKAHFGYLEAPYPEDLLNMSGYMNMEFNQLDKSKMYFEQAIKYYPKSANVYDSMADFYESQGDYANAIKYVKKALEINQKEYYQKRIKALNERMK
ncbi:alpha/beta hydrolase-fold protein [Aureibacter tunicatorum]|uniref:Esterase n=1 Tax=Aureibacter tunicatorum TaxID=866807 RepID=A0AAE3XRY1_9BACT|nr:alpha/beta hydrolase-fold protein [Aureibacter tunicatorum]MDR6242042.1 hypothetical protein [Aureibacter tunicatorum]BDD03617.1 hypothetical protein AUTU_11000 [Aureibacter tunicatorum]